VKRWLITLVAIDAALGLSAHFVPHSNVVKTLTGATSVLLLALLTAFVLRSLLAGQRTERTRQSRSRSPETRRPAASPDEGDGDASDADTRSPRR